MSAKIDVLSLGGPLTNHRSVVVVCQAQILVLAEIETVTVSISRVPFFFPQFLPLLISTTSVSRAFNPGSDEAINSCH